MSEAKPVVTWKFGASLDGRIAAADGSSRWITSAEARADAHWLRSASDAVLVGSGTQRVDDPHLAVRDAVADRQPLRVVGDPANPHLLALLADEELHAPALLVAVPVDRARPRLPLFASDDPVLAERTEEGLLGFGEGPSA
jgi:diaminohydroxyphosphoribosylaminopyrimidine deaminase / 5-amino-6-(5-phosphoribosylamino)uracil reductase